MSKQQNKDTGMHKLCNFLRDNPDVINDIKFNYGYIDLGLFAEMAIRSGNLNLLNHLLEEHMVSANSTTENGGSLLHIAAIENNKDAAGLLIGHGANQFETNRFGETPAETANKLGYFDLAVSLEEVVCSGYVYDSNADGF